MHFGAMLVKSIDKETTACHHAPMDDACSRAREDVWKAIEAAGGPYLIARQADIQVTQLYGWRKRARGIGEDRLARLRALLPSIGAATWGDACVPPAEDVPPAPDASVAQ